MIKSAETIRLEAVQERLEDVVRSLQSVETQLSFVQGDEIHEVASDSVQPELRQIDKNLHRLRQWVENALVTMHEIDFEAEERRLQRNA